MRRAVVLGVALLGGCDLVFRLDGNCYGSEDNFARLCLADPVPVERVVTGDEIFDTVDGCAAIKSGPDDVCVIGADRFTIDAGGRLLGTGPKPLVIVGDVVEIAGKLDVSGPRVLAGPPGAGASTSAALCVGVIEAVHAPMEAGGGGYGGSFGGAGGAGGSVNDSTGGVPGETDQPQILRAGCPGGDGANNGALLGRAGDGGGAIAVIARDRLEIGGRIDASGGGGRGGADGALAVQRGGGGGGGSGGMIVLDAPMVGIPGTVLANGGAGAAPGGAEPGPGGGNSEGPDQPAMGGTNAEGRGGNGATGVLAPEPGSFGGGGGGAVGVIFTFPIKLGFPATVMSPAAAEI